MIPLIIKQIFNYSTLFPLIMEVYVLFNLQRAFENNCHKWVNNLTGYYYLWLAIGLMMPQATFYFIILVIAVSKHYIPKLTKTMLVVDVIITLALLLTAFFNYYYNFLNV